MIYLCCDDGENDCDLKSKADLVDGADLVKQHIESVSFKKPEKEILKMTLK